MQTNKTQPTTQDAAAYLATVADETRRTDAIALAKLMADVTGEAPIMWGPAIIGFGKYHYKYASGREGDTMAVGFAARKNALVLYGLHFYNDDPQTIKLMEKLGRYETGKGCLYVKKLTDINQDVLRQMVANAFRSQNNA